MASNLSRRQFFKAAAGLGVATGFSPTVRRVLLEPFVRHNRSKAVPVSAGDSSALTKEAALVAWSLTSATN